MCSPRGCEGRWRRRPRPLSGRGWRGRQLLIVPVFSRVWAEVVGPACRGPSGRSSGIEVLPSLGTPRCPLFSAEAGAALRPPRLPGRGLQRLCGPSPRPAAGNAGFFLWASPSLPGGMCLRRGCGVGALCAECPLSPRDAGVWVHVWRRYSAPGFLAGCGETPPG